MTGQVASRLTGHTQFLLEGQGRPPQLAPGPGNVPEVRTARAEVGAGDGAHFDVFLSHNRRDRAIVERIAERLKRSGLEPWLDKWSHTPGGEWQEELGRGVEASRACAVFVGPSDLGAWGLQELAFALDRSARERDFRVFPVLLPGVREPFDPTVLPHFLRTRTWVDFRRGYDSQRALQDLIAAVKGVPFGPSVPIEPRTGLMPYRGLQPFGEEEAKLFFGRDREVQRLIEMLKRASFLAVVGASGSGKSSLVGAGLVPALRAGALPDVTGWTVCVLQPGADPLGTLAARIVSLESGEGMQATLDALGDDPRTLHLASALALASRPSGERLLLVVDQLEETFTLTNDGEARSSFFDNLLFASSAAGGRCTVAVTVRADFYPRLAAYPELAQQVAAHQFLVSPMDRDALRQVIEEPARLAGMEFESGLVDTILEDVATQPGALPLLEHALLELWERRRGGMLTLEGYRESGGVGGALATRAEAIYGRFDADRKAVAQRVLLRLTQPGEGTEDTRRRATMNELVTGRGEADSVEGVVGDLAQARMLTVSGGGPGEERWVDVSHEALIRGWQRLRGWVEEDRAGLQVHRRLSEAAQEWQRLGRDEALVHRGALLTEAVEWRKDHELTLNELERAFLAASLERERRERGARRRRLSVAFGLLALGLVAIAAVAVVAINQRRDAVDQRNIAESRELALQSADALGVDPELGLRLALLAVDKWATEQAAAALREATLAFRQVAVVEADSLDANTASYSPDGKRVVTGGTDGRALVWDVATRRVAGSLAAGHGAVLAARYAPGGEQIALGFVDGTVAVTDRSLSAPRVLMREKGQRVESVAFSGDGERIAAGLGDGTVRVLATDGSEPAQRLRGHEGPVLGVDISADGSRVVSAGEDGSVRLWNAVDGGMERVLHSGERPETDVDFSPNGNRILGVGEDGWIRLWDARSGIEERRLSGEGRQLNAAAFSADGRRFAAGGRDGVTRVWSVGGGPPVAVLRGQRSRVYDVGFGPTSDRVVSAGDDGTVRIWDSDRTQTWTVPSLTYDIEFNRDGRSLASGSADGTMRVWDPATGRLRASLPGPDGITLGKFSPTADTLVISSNSSRVRLWPVSTKSAEVAAQLPEGRSVADAHFDATGNRIVYTDDSGRVAVRDLRSGRKVVLGGTPKVVYGAEWSPDGQYVFVVPDRDVLVWRIDRPARPEFALKGHDGSVQAMDFSRDGRILTAGADRTVRIWDAGGRPRVVMRGHEDEVTTALFTADGTQVLSASQDGSVRLFDAGTGVQLGVLQSTEGELYDVALSGDGKIATLGKDEVVRVFPCNVCGSLDRVRALALSRSPRPLTAEERQQFLAAAE